MVVNLPMYLLVWSFLIVTLARGDAEVSCVFNESCILPCSFQSSTEVEIYWIHVTGNTPVHSYYNNQDQLTHQGQRFRGRTSLIKDQISRGNASLQLTRVEVQDQGRYQCYTSSIYDGRESFINIKVDAPVRKVDIQQVGNRITCSSEGIYPEPELTWSTSPPSNETFRNTTTVQKTEQQLYNISSSLILSHSLTDLDFSCNISTRRNWRRETLSKPNAEVSCVFMESCILPCSFQSSTEVEIHWNQVTGNTPVHSYYNNQDQLTQQDQRFRGRTSLIKDQISRGNASLQLTRVEVQDQGRYQCYTSSIYDGRKSFINLKVDDTPYVQEQTNVGTVVGSVVGGIFGLAVIGGLAAYCIYKRTTNRSTRQTSGTAASEPQESDSLTNGTENGGRQNDPEQEEETNVLTGD